MLRYFRFPILDFGFRSQIANLKSKIQPRSMLLAFLMWATLLVSVADADVPSPPPGEDAHAFYLLVGERMFRSREFTRAREAFEKVLDLDSQDAQAHYFLGLIEYEEGNIERAKTRFRIAHECVSGLMDSWAYGSVSQLTCESMRTLPDTKQVQLEFPDEYKARVYYKDGWYVKSKPESRIEAHGPIDLLTLEAGSAYRIELEPGRKESWARRGIIGLIVAMSFLLAR